MPENTAEKLEKIAKDFETNLNSDRPSVRTEVAYAYQDEKVRESIANHIESGEELSETFVLAPDTVLNLRRVYFQFGTDTAFLSEEDARSLSKPGVLVQIDDNNKVVDIKDHFVLKNDIGNSSQDQSSTFSGRYAPPTVTTSTPFDRFSHQFEKFAESEGLQAAFRKSFSGARAMIAGTSIPTMMPTVCPPGTPCEPTPDITETEDDGKTSGQLGSGVYVDPKFVVDPKRIKTVTFPGGVGVEITPPVGPHTNPNVWP